MASNPAAVAIHEARTIFPDVQIELIVSCGTGAFLEEKSEPRIGWVRTCVEYQLHLLSCFDINFPIFI